jgi:hypothetical protein
VQPFSFSLTHPGQPGSCVDLGDNRQNLDVVFGYVVEHANVADTQSELWLRQTPESLDSTATDLGGFMPKVFLKRIFDSRANIRLKAPEIVNSLWSQNDLATHPGHNIARVWP